MKLHGLFSVRTILTSLASPVQTRALVVVHQEEGDLGDCQRPPGRHLQRGRVGGRRGLGLVSTLWAPRGRRSRRVCSCASSLTGTSVRSSCTPSFHRESCEAIRACFRRLARFKCRHDLSFWVAAALRVPLGTTGMALIDPRAPPQRVKPGKSLQIAAKKKEDPRPPYPARPRDGWHFSGDGVRFLQAGERPRVWRTKSLISRLQAEARRRSLTDGAAVAERRVLGR